MTANYGNIIQYLFEFNMYTGIVFLINQDVSFYKVCQYINLEHSLMPKLYSIQIAKDHEPILVDKNKIQELIYTVKRALHL